MNHTNCGLHSREHREQPWWGSYYKWTDDAGQVRYGWRCDYCYAAIVVSEAEYTKNKGA